MPGEGAPLEGGEAEREERLRRWVAHGLAFALTATLLKLAINSVASPFRGDPALYAGLALGLFSELGVGLVVSAPLLVRVRRAPESTFALVFALAIAALAVDAAAFHAHAVLRYLPGRESLAFLRDPGALRASFDEHASPLVIALEATAAVALFGVLGALLSKQARRFTLRNKQVSALALAAMCALFALPRVTAGQAHHGASNPVLHVLYTAHATESAEAIPQLSAASDARGPDPLQSAVRTVSDVLAPAPPLVPRDARFPYCRAGTPASAARTPRSIILLILESVGKRESELVIDGKPVMPELARITREGLSFSRFYASGDRSSQGLVALLSGISAETHRRVLTHAPLAHLPSLPHELGRAGYTSLYVHGSDLSFEQQREYLRKLGMSRIVEPTPREMSARLGWGLPDEITFAQLEGALDAHRREQGGAPLFATLFTLSTHDPYVLPANAPKLLDDDAPYARFVNSLAYTDAQLGRFYAWYLSHERPKGTLLAIVGDHTGRVPFPADPLDTSTGEFEYRFGVPFVLAGLRDEELATYRAHTTRVGGQLDVPQTLLELVGLDGAHCFEGRSLVAPSWPARRYVASLAGENLSFLYLQDGRLRWMWALAEQRVRVYDERDDPMFRHDLYRAELPDAALLASFVPAYFQLGSYLNLGDHFAPRERPPDARPARTGPERPLLVSHRGRTNGALDDRKDNTLDAIREAHARGFEWVELDLQTTRDGVVVLAHDPDVRARDGGTHALTTLSLAEARKLVAPAPLPTLAEALAAMPPDMHVCLEVKPQAVIFDTMNLVTGVIRALEGVAPERVIIDSFSRTTLASFADLTQFEVGYDLPQKPVQDEWLDYASQSGFEWVYVQAPFVTRDVVQRAHARGLKVMAYPLNDPRALDALAPERVDGVITDVADAWGID